MSVSMFTGRDEGARCLNPASTHRVGVSNNSSKQSAEQEPLASGVLVNTEGEAPHRVDTASHPSRR